MLFYEKARMLRRHKRRYVCVCDEGAVDASTCRKWFRKFRENNFNLSDVPRSERPAEVDGNEILALIESDQYRTTWEIGKILEIN